MLLRDNWKWRVIAATAKLSTLVRMWSPEQWALHWFSCVLDIPRIKMGRCWWDGAATIDERMKKFRFCRWLLWCFSLYLSVYFEYLKWNLHWYLNTRNNVAFLGAFWCTICVLFRAHFHHQNPRMWRLYLRLCKIEEVTKKCVGHVCFCVVFDVVFVIVF